MRLNFASAQERAARGGGIDCGRSAGQPFLLVSRGDQAWSNGPLQEQAIIAALRTAGGMRIEARDLAGRRFADPYLLDGAPTAIDAAATACAGKMQPR